MVSEVVDVARSIGTVMITWLSVIGWVSVELVDIIVSTVVGVW